MNWEKVSVEINQESIEAVSNIMEEAGAQGVVLEEDGNRVVVTAYYHDNPGFSEIYQVIKKKVNRLQDFGLKTGEIIFSLSLTSDEDWSTSWHKYFKPLPIGEIFLICPEWEECQDSKRQVIKINPGMAFGIGSHETTQLSIEMLEKYAGNKKQEMLDIGTGTGILTIVAAHLGIGRILGIDIDPAAVSAARKNIKINGVEERVIIKKGDLTKDITGRFNLITANLLPNIIFKLLPSIPEIIKVEGTLILSGITLEKSREISEQLVDLDFNVIEQVQKNEWIALVARKTRRG